MRAREYHTTSGSRVQERLDSVSDLWLAELALQKYQCFTGGAFFLVLRTHVRNLGKCARKWCWQASAFLTSGRGSDYGVSPLSSIDPVAYVNHTRFRIH
jgi:hypothetical protein